MNRTVVKCSFVNHILIFNCELELTSHIGGTSLRTEGHGWETEILTRKQEKYEGVKHEKSKEAIKEISNY